MLIRMGIYCEKFVVISLSSLNEAIDGKLVVDKIYCEWIGAIITTLHKISKWRLMFVLIK